MYTIEKEGCRLVFTRKKDNRKAEYDLATKEFFMHHLDGKINKVKGIQALFAGTDLNYHSFENWFSDKKYAQFVKAVSRNERRVKNIGTILQRLSEYAHLEQYFAIGLDVETRDGYGIIRKPLSFYNKRTIKMLKDNNIKLNSDIEAKFVNCPNVENVLFYISENRKDLFANYFYEITRNGYFMQLVEEYSYDYKRLIEYLEYIDQYEGYDKFRAIWTLRDYARMSVAISRNGKFEKYPRYLKTMHDISVRNYNNFKTEHNEELFKKAVDKYINLEYNDKEHMIIVPKITQDMKNEGVRLSHCVASYVDSVINGSTKIMFLRKKEKEEVSLVTIEVRDKKVSQARGFLNRSIQQEEREFIEKWAKNKGLEVSNNL